MATLSGKTLFNTYKELLKIDNSVGNTGITSTLQTIEAGDGVDTALQLSTQAARVNGAFEVSSGNNTVLGGTLTVTGAITGNGGYNGTVGATTANTGVFTTLSSTGNTTIGDASADTLTINATPTFATAAGFAAGAVGTPSITRSSDLDTGMWFPAANTVAFSEGGVEALRINSDSAIIFGNGDTSATPAASTLRGTDGSGSNIVGGSLTIRGGRGTGTGAGGSIILQTTPTGASGSALNTSTEALRIDASQNVGIGTQANASTRLHVQNTSATTNAVTNVLRLDSQSSGTPAVGIGVGLQFAVETAANNTEVGATIEAITTDVAAATEDFDLSFKTMAAGAAAAERMRVTSTGDLKFNSGYGSVATGYGVRAWGVIDTSNNATCSISWPAASTTATVTLTSHGLAAGNGVYFSNFDPVGTYGHYTVVASTGVNTFTINMIYTAADAGYPSGFTAANLNIRRPGSLVLGRNITSYTDFGPTSTNPAIYPPAIYLRFRLTFPAMPDANYSAIATGGNPSTTTGLQGIFVWAHSKTTTTCDFNVWHYGATDTYSSDMWANNSLSVAIIR